MSSNVNGLISWLRQWFDDIYAPKGQTGVSINNVYPVGSIYMSVNDVNPANLFGGSWEQIKDKFLLSKGDIYNTIGETGGSSTVTLTANQSGIRAHGHGMSHTHSHNHISSAWESKKAASGTAQPIPRGRTNSSKDGTFETDTDSTASSKSITDNNTAQNATEAHNNMPPYLVVNIWKRTA